MRPDRISKQEIEKHQNILPEPLRTTASNKIALHDAIATLRRYSLIDATSEFISVHRLVQLVVRDRLEPRDYRSFHEIADRLEHGPSDASGYVVLEGPQPQSRRSSIGASRLRFTGSGASWEFFAAIPISLWAFYTTSSGIIDIMSLGKSDWIGSIGSTIGSAAILTVLALTSWSLGTDLAALLIRRHSGLGALKGALVTHILICPLFVGVLFVHVLPPKHI
jgi:hypothetical protein